MATGGQVRNGVYSVLGIKEETTLGTYLTATVFMPFSSESFKVVSPKIKIEEVNGSRNTTRVFQGPKHVTGSIEANLNVQENCQMYIVKQAMGGTCSSTRPVALGGYSHVFEEGNMEANASTVTVADVKGLSIFVKRGETTTASWGFAGMRVNSLTIKGEYGKPVVMTAEMVGVSGSLTTYAAGITTSFASELPLLFAGVSVREAATYGSVTSVTADYFQSFEFSINNNLISDDSSRSLGSRDLAVLPPSKRDCTLKLTQRFDTTTAWQKFIDHTTSAIRIMCQGVNTLSAVALDTVASFHIDLPYVVWEDSAQPAIKGAGTITQEISGIPYQATTTAYMVKLLANNNTAGY